MKDDTHTVLVQEMVKFQHDPLGFVKWAFQWGKGELEGYSGPEAWQTWVLEEVGRRVGVGEDVYNAVQIAVASGHGVGKSALVSWLMIWAMSTRENTRGVVTANTENQLKTKTWAELAKWYRLFIGQVFFKLTATAIFSAIPECEKTWRIDQVVWTEHNSEAFAGLHNQGNRILVIFDEASAISDTIWQVTEGALTDKGTEIMWMVFGNPTRSTGRFYECFNRYKHRWQHKQVDSREVSITNKEQIDKWIEDYGDDSDFAKVRILGEFPDVSELQFIPTNIVRSARMIKLKPQVYEKAPVIIGVDPAWSGTDSTVIFLRQGLYSKLLAKFSKLQDDTILAGHIMQLEDKWKADKVFIDFGYGTGVYSAGKQMGRKWMLVNFGSESTDDMFANKRGEIWGAMKKWLMEGGAIPDDDDLQGELIGPEHYVRTVKPHAGKILLESKENMKKRGLSSPNMADALALTFSFPVKNKSERLFNKVISTFTNKNYDIFNTNMRNEEVPKYNPLSPLIQGE